MISNAARRPRGSTAVPLRGTPRLATSDKALAVSGCGPSGLGLWTAGTVEPIDHAPCNPVR